MLLQVEFDLLGRIFEKIPLHIFQHPVLLNPPNDMDVVGHDDKSVYFHSSVFHKEAHALHDHLFVLVGFEQLLPPEDGGGEKLDVVRVHQ